MYKFFYLLLSRVTTNKNMHIFCLYCVATIQCVKFSTPPQLGQLQIKMCIYIAYIIYLLLNTKDFLSFFKRGNHKREYIYKLLILYIYYWMLKIFHISLDKITIDNNMYMHCLFCKSTIECIKIRFSLSKITLNKNMCINYLYYEFIIK